jgi:hypothetical protein
MAGRVHPFVGSKYASILPARHAPDLHHCFALMILLKVDLFDKIWSTHFLYSICVEQRFM